MPHMIRRACGRLHMSERGAGLVEYTLLVALIALVCVGALSFFGQGSGGRLINSASCITAAHNGQPLPPTCP